jgi:hypothetical protein
MKKVVITAHKGYLIIDSTSMGKASKDWVPIGSGRIGCVVIDTKKYLDVSEEALALLGNIKRCGDDIGDVDWFESGDKKVFGWLGNEARIVKAAEAEGSRTYKVYRDDCTIVPNNPPEGAIAAIEKALTEN